jgi:hypothetical protein
MISTRYHLTPIAFTAVHSISDKAPTEREVEITAVPYYVWDNRTPDCVPEIGIQNEHNSHHSESG